MFKAGLATTSIVAGLAAASLGIQGSAAVPASDPISNPSPSYGQGPDGEVKVATGVVTGNDGQPAGNETVVLQAWPSTESLSTLQPGEEVKMAVVDSDVTDSSGAFDVSVADTSLLDHYKNAEGVVDFQVIAVTDDGVAVQNFPVAVPATTGTGGAASALATTATETNYAVTGVELEPIADTIAPAPEPETDDLAPVSEEVLEAPPADNEPVVEVPKACGTVYVGSLGNAWVRLGYGYAYSGATMDFTYTTGSTSELGVGVSSSGRFGTFKASGTASARSTASVSFARTSSFKIWKSQFKMGKYFTSCANYGVITGSYYTARVRAYIGGAAVQGVAGAPSTPYCVTHASGSGFTTEYEKAYSNSVGWDSDTLIGVDLSARTGYSSAAKINFQFDKRMKLCGTHGYPADNPKRLVARPL